MKSFHLKISDYEKKSGFTFVEQAIVLVPEFEQVVRNPELQGILRGQEVVNLKISDIDFVRKTMIC